MEMVRKGTCCGNKIDSLLYRFLTKLLTGDLTFSLAHPKRLFSDGSSISPPALPHTDPPPGWCCATRRGRVSSGGSHLHVMVVVERATMVVVAHGISHKLLWARSEPLGISVNDNQQRLPSSPMRSTRIAFSRSTRHYKGAWCTPPHMLLASFDKSPNVRPRLRTAARSCWSKSISTARL